MAEKYIFGQNKLGEAETDSFIQKYCVQEYFIILSFEPHQVYFEMSMVWSGNVRP